MDIDESIKAFVATLPKVELHVHIEGTLSPSLRWRLAQKNKINLPYKTYEELCASYATMYNHRKELNGDNGLPTFLESYYGGMTVLLCEDDFYDLAMEYFAKAAKMKVRYAEIFFDPQAHTRRGVELESVMNGLHRARLDAKEKYGVEGTWIMCFLRDMMVSSAEELYQQAVPEFSHVFRAIGLDSNEYDRPAGLFKEVFRRARDDGFKITAHCDVCQKDTHEHILEVATSCVGGIEGADRIDHGLNVSERPELIKLIKAKGLGLTLCPHAYHRRLPTDYVFGNIRKLWDEGLLITISSDDPAYMHQRWITENLELAMKHSKFTQREMVQLQRNAVNISWAENAVKESILKELEVVKASM